MEGTEVTDSASASSEEGNTAQCSAQPWLDTLRGEGAGEREEKPPHGRKKTSGKQEEFVPHTMEGQDVILQVAGHGEH